VPDPPYPSPAHNTPLIINIEPRYRQRPKLKLHPDDPGRTSQRQATASNVIQPDKHLDSTRDRHQATVNRNGSGRSKWLSQWWDRSRVAEFAVEIYSASIHDRHPGHLPVLACVRMVRDDPSATVLVPVEITTKPVLVRNPQCPCRPRAQAAESDTPELHSRDTAVPNSRGMASEL